ncbi:MAG TPA: IPT/TIG domain-containing protein, partial [Candidatus Polarisedimenticolia bacterium]|nr:IPT/TIG domain-containing protein [Candidatus Polarisedimenticolia bacterium]
MKRCPRFWHAALLAGLLATAGGATSAFATGFEALSIDPAFVPKNTAPASAPAVIRGIGFTPTVTVKFDGVSATVTFINSRTLSVQIPTSAIGKETRVTVADGADSDDIFPFIYTDGVLYVKPTGNDASNGTTPATAKRTIFGALDTTTAAIPWLIKVAAGTYTESDLPVYSRVVLSGGWDPNFAVRDPDKFVTVVDGGRATLVLRTAGLDGRQVIDGLTIRNGERDGLGGGAIVITGDNTVVSNSVIVGNTSSARGGAIYSFFSTTYGGESVFSNNVILGNRSYSKSGGAINIYPFYTQGQVLDVAISDNYIMGNRSMKSFGGGVDVSTQALYGYNNVNLAMVGNVIGGNRAVTGGGIAIMASSSADDFRLNFDNNLLFGNIVTGDGGGIYFSGVGHIAASVTAATLSANAAGQDGGGGIRFAPGVSYEAGFEAKNLVVWGNTNGNYVGGPLLTYSDVQGGATGTGNIGSNPGFVAGPMGSFYLAQDANMMSPAVDAGSSSALSLSMESRTTSSTLTLDADQVDMGYH